jgi:hypothetical protein
MKLTIASSLSLSMTGVAFAQYPAQQDRTRSSPLQASRWVGGDHAFGVLRFLQPPDRKIGAVVDVVICGGKPVMGVVASVGSFSA